MVVESGLGHEFSTVTSIHMCSFAFDDLSREETKSYLSFVGIRGTNEFSAHFPGSCLSPVFYRF